MKRKNVIISLLLALVMLFTTFTVNVSKSEAAVNRDTYWLKVNTQCNVITAYKKSGDTYKPIRAMVCSTGKKGDETPIGTFRMGTKIGWCYLVGNVWGRYSMVIKGNYLFHSVPYSKKSISSMKYKEYNKLGTSCSHGCVRLSLVDVKWIWNNCPKGTKITVYKSEDPGPLGKPTPIKMKSSWKYDPTDSNKKNKHYILKAPEIRISSSKPSVVEKGSSYSIKGGITGYNPNAHQYITSNLKINNTYKYSTTKKKYVKADFTTKKTGKYKITYKISSPYCKGTTYAKFYVTVVAPETLNITATDREVIIGTEDAINAVKDVTAIQKSADRTESMTVGIVAPNSDEEIVLSYTDAQEFVFDEEGIYTVTYYVTNAISPYKEVRKSIKINAIYS